MNVLVVGSCLIDFFVRVKDLEQVEIKDKRVSFPLGAKIPIDIKSFSLGGNSANVSSALEKLSISTSLYTYLGGDPLSKHIRGKMEERDIKLLVEDIDTTTGSLSLIFDFPSDRVIFSHHNIAAHGFDAEKVTEKPDIIFLTSIGKEWTGAYEKVLSFASSNNISLAFSPGSQQLREINETFLNTVRQSKILMCNMEEAKIINKALNSSEIENPKELLLKLRTNNFEILSITDGADGAYATNESGNVYKINSPETDGYEKTGAGDAYAGAFLAAYLHKKSIEDCMRWGVFNAIGEMKQIGAQTGQLSLEEMETANSDNQDIKVEII